MREVLHLLIPNVQQAKRVVKQKKPRKVKTPEE
jgi:hypothetical protein